MPRWAEFAKRDILYSTCPSKKNREQALEKTDNRPAIEPSNRPAIKPVGRPAIKLAGRHEKNE